MRYEYDNEGFLVGPCEDAPRSTPIAPQGNENNFTGAGWVFVDRAALDAQKAANEALAAEATRKQNIQNQIMELEKSITERRKREAMLSGDTTFIAGVDAQIAVLRGTL
jgi:hypothetical protein